MTSGIYKLNFPSGLFYVGKSNNIERRWEEHSTKFEKGTAAKPLQAAFDRWGYPTPEILVKCHEDNIDVMEAAYIHAGFKQIGRDKCLNTSIPKDPGITKYEDNVVTKSLKEQMEWVVELQKQIERYENELEQQEVDHRSEVLSIEDGRRVLQLERDLANLAETIEYLNEDIRKLKNRNWFQRLFNLN